MPGVMIHSTEMDVPRDLVQPLFAVVVHGHQEAHAGTSEPAFATLHKLAASEQGPVIGPGKLMGHDEMASWMQSWKATGATSQASRTNNQAVEHWMPRELLAYQPGEFMAWYWKGQIAPMQFNVAQMGTFTLEVPWPSLVFGVCGQKLYVVALAHPRRPRQHARVFQAPLLNIYGPAGGVCQGTGAIKGIGPYWHDRRAWESVILESAFSHTGNCATLKAGRRKTPTTGDHVRFWKRLAKTHARVFPRDRLIAMEQSLDRVISSWRKGG